MLILRRVVVEDRFLRGNLAGYDLYAARVRNRVIPGVW
jgi:protein-S-isoprenylcysteine O-methyltransferase Ste14